MPFEAVWWEGQAESHWVRVPGPCRGRKQAPLLRNPPACPPRVVPQERRGQWGPGREWWGVPAPQSLFWALAGSPRAAACCWGFRVAAEHSLGRLGAPGTVQTGTPLPFIGNPLDLPAEKCGGPLPGPQGGDRSLCCWDTGRCSQSHEPHLTPAWSLSEHRGLGGWAGGHPGGW